MDLASNGKTFSKDNKSAIALGVFTGILIILLLVVIIGWMVTWIALKKKEKASSRNPKGRYM